MGEHPFVCLLEKHTSHNSSDLRLKLYPTERKRSAMPSVSLCIICTQSYNCRVQLSLSTSAEGVKIDLSPLIILKTFPPASLKHLI